MKHGENVRRMKQIDKELHRLTRQMKQLESQGGGMGRLYLDIHGTGGCLSLRWRWRNHDHDYVEPTEVQEGHKYVLGQGGDYLDRFTRIETSRIELNHQYSVLFHERKRCRMLANKQQGLKKLKQRWSASERGNNNVVRL